MISVHGCGDIPKHDVGGWRGNTEEGIRKKKMLKSLPEGRVEMDER